MPRLKRQARDRRARPELARGVWEWLNGRAYDDLPDGTKFDLLMLETYEHDLEAFWDRVHAAVEAGKIAISETKKHCLGDPPLLQSRNECDVSRP